MYCSPADYSVQQDANCRTKQAPDVELSYKQISDAIKFPTCPDWTTWTLAGNKRDLAFRSGEKDFLR